MKAKHPEAAGRPAGAAGSIPTLAPAKAGPGPSVAILEASDEEDEAS